MKGGDDGEKGDAMKVEEKDGRRWRRRKSRRRRRTEEGEGEVNVLGKARKRHEAGKRVWVSCGERRAIVSEAVEGRDSLLFSLSRDDCERVSRLLRVPTRRVLHLSEIFQTSGAASRVHLPLSFFLCPFFFSFFFVCVWAWFLGDAVVVVVPGSFLHLLRLYFSLT